MSNGMVAQIACLLVGILGTGLAKHYIDQPLATDCITKEVLWAVNYHHDLSVPLRKFLEYDSMTCDQNKQPYEKNYNELLKKGYTDMIAKCVDNQKVDKIKKEMEKCVDAKIKVQMERLKEVKTLIEGCKAPEKKVEMVELKETVGKNLTQPISLRSKSARRRSYL
uniref:Hypothetical secreted protein n=1 Tax=Simulium guianense TaxID=445764 RepID=F5GTT6_SIMGU